MRQEKVNELLKGNFHLIKHGDLNQEELDFLSYFFNISEEEEVDPEEMEIKKYLVLEKKEKFLYH